MSGRVSVKGIAPEIQNMDNDSLDSLFTSRFYCDWDWHMRKLRSVPAVLIYSLASRVTAKKRNRIFDPAAETIASSYGFDASTVHRAIKPLCELGFFEKLGKTRHGTNRYRVIPHREWMKQHPGQCAVFQPWSEDEQTEETGETLTLVEPEVTAELPECKDHSIADVKQHSKQEECEKSSAIGTQSASGGAKRASVKARRKVDSASVMATDPEVTSLARELAYLSNGEINFSDKQRIRFAEVLKEFTSEEIKSAFKSWLDDQDLSEPKNVSFLPGQFVQVVDGLAYASRRLKQEAEQAKIARDAAVAQLQAQAEAERLQREKAEKAEAANLFDPLADVA